MQFTLAGHRTSAEAAWRLIGDTDYLNRRAGNGAIKMLGVDESTGIGTGQVEGPLGVPISFRECDVSWVVGRFFRQERVYDAPGQPRSRYEARLEPDGDGVIPHITLSLLGDSPLLTPLLAVQTRKIHNAWRTLFESLPGPGQSALPTVIRSLAGPAADAFVRWEAEAASPVIAQMRSLFTTGQPLELQEIRPFQLADRWEMDREQVLVSMLRGVRAGALEMVWSVRCPKCRGQTASPALLSDLPDHSTCSACKITVATDLGQHVEVVFAAHPGLVDRVEGRFCTMFPALAPEPLAVLSLAAGQRETVGVWMRPGAWRIGAIGPDPDTPVLSDGEAKSAALRWSVGEGTTPHRVLPGEVEMVLNNTLPTAVRVQLIAAEPPEDRVPASLITTLPDFRRQMGHQVLRRDLRVGVRSVALLFTDLTASTAMYEEVGDAAAFSVVRDHFELLKDAVESSGGVVVKTIGDAIMAAFHTPERALNAALKMQRAFIGWRDGLGLRQAPALRVGLHVGPALVVHSDTAGLDYFGRTVNIAARAQGAAAGDEIVWTDDVQRDAGVARRIAEEGLQPALAEVALKGLHGLVAVWRCGVILPV